MVRYGLAGVISETLHLDPRARRLTRHEIEAIIQARLAALGGAPIVIKVPGLMEMLQTTEGSQKVFDRSPRSTLPSAGWTKAQDCTRSTCAYRSRSARAC